MGRHKKVADEEMRKLYVELGWDTSKTLKGNDIHFVMKEGPKGANYEVASLKAFRFKGYGPGRPGVVYPTQKAPAYSLNKVALCTNSVDSPLSENLEPVINKVAKLNEATVSYIPAVIAGYGNKIMLKTITDAINGVGSKRMK